MAKSNPAKTAPVNSASKEESSDADKNNPALQLGKFLTRNKGDHFNFEEGINWFISTGSLNLDSAIGGGITPGIVRHAGAPASGKTSEALEIVSNFFALVPNSYAIYVKTEGRLSKNVQDRSGLKFTTDFEKWGPGIVFVLETNIYETIIELMRELVRDNPNKCRYCFILDSVDMVNLKNDYIKKIEDGVRVGGSPLMTKQFLQKTALEFSKKGHLGIYISQKSAEIRTSQYEKGAGRQVDGAGGNAIQHLASYVFEFLDWYESDMILEDENAKMDPVKNKPLGHYCKIKVKKSDNENRYFLVKIPIRHNQVGGKSIWKEREIADQIVGWGMLEKAGSWMKFAPTFVKELRDAGFKSFPEQVQGMNKVQDLLDSDSKLVEYLFARFKDMLTGKIEMTEEPKETIEDAAAITKEP